MGLRDSLKSRVKGLVDKLSGEHSDVAPTEPTATYSKPGKPNEDAEVVMARLNRPKKKKS